MEKKNTRTHPALKKVSFLNSKSHEVSSCDANAEIRLGISLADEKAKQESIKRKVNAPLTTEEKIFLGKL